MDRHQEYAVGRGSHDPETKMLFHGRKAAVVVQQRVTAFDAKRADDNVGGLTDGDAQLPQLAAVPGGARGKIGVQHGHKGIPPQSLFNMRGMGLVPGALENVEQDEVADQERFPCDRGLGRLAAMPPDFQRGANYRVLTFASALRQHAFQVSGATSRSC
jgi:hypothetical protein